MLGMHGAYLKKGKKNLNSVLSHYLHFKCPVAICGYCIGWHRFRTFPLSQKNLSDSNALQFTETFLSLVTQTQHLQSLHRTQRT